MEARNLTITLVSAENLPHVRNFGETKVYAEVSLNGDTQTTRCSEVDMSGGTNPTWNFKTGYTMVVESGIEKPGVDVVVKLMCKRTLRDKLIGEVKIPVKSLFDKGLKSKNVMSYNVEGSLDGRLNILYSFGVKIVVPKGSTSGKIVPKGLVARGPTYTLGPMEVVSIGLLVEGAGSLFI